MTPPTNDEFSNCELSAEELEAIAAGWPHWLKTVVHDVGHYAGYAIKYTVIGGMLFSLGFLGGVAKDNPGASLN